MADDEMDARTIAVEERCIEMLAFQAPVASDLRHVVAALRMSAEIERSADLVVNICKAARRIYGHDLDPKLRGTIAKMGEQAHSSTARRSTPTSNWMRRRPGDRRHGLISRWVAEAVRADDLREPRRWHIDLQVAVQLAVVARFYERIGDHAVNIGERVRYLITGWMPEHVGAARYRSRVESEDADPMPVPDGVPEPGSD